HFHLYDSRPVHLVALREDEPAGHDLRQDGLDQRAQLAGGAAGNRVFEDAVTGEEAAHRGVDLRLRVQREDDVTGDTELLAEGSQNGGVRLAAGERLAIAHGDVQVSLEDGALLRRYFRIEAFRHQPECGDDFRR